MKTAFVLLLALAAISSAVVLPQREYLNREYLNLPWVERVELPGHTVNCKVEDKEEHCGKTCTCGTLALVEDKTTTNVTACVNLSKTKEVMAECQKQLMAGDATKKDCAYRTMNASTVCPHAKGQTISAKANNPCVASTWLRKQGLAHETISHGDVARVLCIPGSGLPCGTHGHMLRQCAPGTSCKLVTYKQACAERLDCIESEIAVSQLSHSFDWSKFASNDGMLQLTSLSAHPDATAWSFSRFVAVAADTLNSAGLGTITNSIARYARLESSILLGLASFWESITAN